MSIVKENTKQTLNDIIVDVSWANISKRYFGKSRSWLHHKLQGTDSQGGFTDEEQQDLKLALKDLAKRINHCADNL
mgnify:CR=1 FL=1